MKPEAARLYQLIFGSFPAQVVHVLATLDIADHLAGGPLSGADLAERAGCHEPSLVRVLLAAVHLDLVRLGDNGLYELTPTGRLLCADEPGGVKNVAKSMCGEHVWRSLGRLDHTVRTGESAVEQVFGQTGYEWLADNPQDASVFHAAMAESAEHDVRSLLGICDFSGIGTVVDIGGGNGILMAALLAANPGLAGAIFDSPQGLATTRARLSAQGVEDRCDLVAGDFFADPAPVGADVYVVKHVLNDWDDEHAARILRTCGEAMRENSELMIIEQVMPTDSADLAGVPLVLGMSDLAALVGNGGKLRTAEEFETLLAAAGLRLIDIADHQSAHLFSILRAVPLAVPVAAVRSTAVSIAD